MADTDNNTIENNNVSEENKQDNLEDNKDKEIDDFTEVLIKNFKIENNTERNYYYFQIKQIDGVTVNTCYLYCYNSSIEKNKFFFRLVICLDKSINSKIKLISNKYTINQLLNKQLGTFDKNVEEYPTFMKNMTKELIKIFDNLKFDKYYIKFSTIDDIKNDIRQVNLEKNLFSKNCKFNLNECSICYDDCSTVTYCEHSLCIPCLQKLNNNECPMCRKQLFNNNANYNDYDYDSNGEEYTEDYD